MSWCFHLTLDTPAAPSYTTATMDLTGIPQPDVNHSPLRALELFCGIGGFAAAVAGLNVRLVGALDTSETALAVYRLNFPLHPARQVDLERVSAWQLTAAQADLWWLSPPCQPYCERGIRRDLADPRARSLLRLMELLAAIPAGQLPRHLALENVAGFVGSQAHDRLTGLLADRGFHLQERLLCPTRLGVPSRRPRYYLAASRTHLQMPDEPPTPPVRQLADYLEPFPATLPDGLRLPEDILTRFGSGLRLLDPGDPAAATTCFTSGYGRSIVNAGSYLRHGDGARYFAPTELARLLHFPADFRFPDGLPLRKRWHLIGNSLSVVAVREVLRAFPELTAISAAG